LDSTVWDPRPARPARASLDSRFLLRNVDVGYGYGYKRDPASHDEQTRGAVSKVKNTN